MICEILVPVVSTVSARMEYAVIEISPKGKETVRMLSDRKILTIKIMDFLNSAFNEYGYTHRIIEV